VGEYQVHAVRITKNPPSGHAWDGRRAHHNRLTSAVAVGVALASLSVPAFATITGGSITSPGAASFVKLSVPLANPFGAPNSVGNDNFQSRNLFGFDEAQNIVLAEPLAVDLVPSGPLTLPAGTTVASHYVFFDPIKGNISGTVTFDSRVLAVISSTGTLTASDFLANTGVNYISPSLRGLEPGTGDLVTILGQQITFVASASVPGDYIRVLTAYSPAAVVPEPAAYMLLGMGLMAVFLASRRRPASTLR
jgi:hypothetical protein